MNKVKQISSLHNPLVKKVLLLKEKSRERRNSGLFVLEGQREFELAGKGRGFCPTVHRQSTRYCLLQEHPGHGKTSVEHECSNQGN